MPEDHCACIIIYIVQILLAGECISGMEQVTHFGSQEFLERLHHDQS